MPRHLALLSLCLLWIAALSGAAVQPEVPAPAKMRELVGERLEFRISWAGIPVGRAAMEVRLGPEPWLVEMRSTAESLPVLRWIYPVQDSVRSIAVTHGLRAKRYVQISKEGFGDPERTEITFDHTHGAAGTVEDGRRLPWLPVPPEVLDPLSAIYAYRIHPAPGGNPPELPITDGEKLISARMEILGLEQIQVPAGTFQTVKVEPHISDLGGIFRRSPDASIHLWITRDRWRRLVKMETKVAIGTVTVELTGVTPPTGVPRPGVMAREWERWRPEE